MGAMANGRAPMQHMPPSMGLGSTSHLSRQDSETLRAMGVSSVSVLVNTCLFSFVCACMCAHVLIVTCVNVYAYECANPKP